MFPGVDGFRWSPGHVIFLSLFFLVALTLLATAAAALRNTARDLRRGEAPKICWREDFADLPEAERRCRHELAGRVEQRTCPNAFDCRHCPDYAPFAKHPASVAPITFGLYYPEDRFYHRGHSWVKPESDGTVTIGLDDMALHLIGSPDEVVFPAVGGAIEYQSTAWEMTKNGRRIRVRAPLEGTVVATGGPEQGWYLKLQPPGKADLRHLLSGLEVSGWLRSELDRLQIQIAPQSAPALADGGTLMPALMDALPDADWDTALAATFQEP